MLTVNQVAKHYNVDRTAIYRWIKSGMPFSITPSGRKRFTIETIEQWIETRKGEK